jgi:type III secretory pathway component EscU
LFSIPSLVTLYESPLKYCLMTVSLDIMFRNRSCTWCSFSESSGCRPTNFLNLSKLKRVLRRGSSVVLLVQCFCFLIFMSLPLLLRSYSWQGPKE